MTHSHKHTPTPWRIVQNDYKAIVGPDGNGVAVAQIRLKRPANTEAQAIAERDANAALIVRACNSHEELLSAARKFITLNDDPKQTNRPNQQIGFAIEELRAAIAKAEAA